MFSWVCLKAEMFAWEELKLLSLMQICLSVLASHFSKRMSVFLLNISYTYSGTLFRYLPIMNVTVKKLYYGYLLPNGTICEMRNIVPVMKEQALSLLWWESKSWNISRRKKDIVTPVIIVQRQLEIQIICRNVIQFWPNMPVFIKWIPHILCLWRNLALLQKEWKKKV